MRWICTLIALLLWSSLAAASTTPPFRIVGSPTEQAAITQDYNMLTPCAQAKVAASGLRTVKVVKHGHLGIKTIDGEVYYIQAESFSYHGYLALIDQHFVSHPDIVLHEFGHWVDDSYMTKEFGKAWEMAVAADYKGLTKKQQYDNYYLKDPHEAAAEIFSHQMQENGGIKAHNEYDTGLFPRSNALMSQILTQACS